MVDFAFIDSGTGGIPADATGQKLYNDGSAGSNGSAGKVVIWW